MRYRVLALDVDGTILDGSGSLRPTTKAALLRAARAGARLVLCTGRRYRRARPVAEALGLAAPIVCNSGALIKDPTDHRTLWRADYGPGLTRDLFEAFQAHEQPWIAWTDHGASGPDLIVAAYPTGRPHFDEYVRLNREHAAIEPLGPNAFGVGACFHVAGIGDRSDMLAFEGRLHERLDGRALTYVQRSPRHSGFLCEVLDARAGKWAAVMHLAEAWGVEPSAICAVGDDRNDVSMIRGAGLGVAMGHAPPEVLAVADHVTADHDSDGVARLIDELLSA